MRSLSSTLRAALYSQDTSDAPIILVTIEPPSDYVAPSGDLYQGDPLRLSNNNTTRPSVEPLRYGTISRGNNFDFVPGLDVILPEEADDVPYAAQLVATNVDRVFTPALKSLTRRAVVTVEIVRLSNPSFVEALFPDFRLVSALLRDVSVSADLVIDTMEHEPYPAHDMTPGRFPAVFIAT